MIPVISLIIDSFYITKDVEELSRRVLNHLGLDGVDGISCLLFPSLPSASRCAKAIQEAGGTGNTVIPVQFSRPDRLPDENSWLNIHVIIFPSKYFSAAFISWIHTGDGISPRHAAFCLTGFDYLHSTSVNPAFCTASTKPLAVKGEHLPVSHNPETVERDYIKREIATLVQSEDLDQLPPSPNDVFLYPGGMSAVNAVMRAVGDLGVDTGVVAFG